MRKISTVLVSLSPHGKTKLDHCVITVTDWERSNQFYRDVLGAELVPFTNGWAYRFGTEQLNVHGPGQRVGLDATASSRKSSPDCLRKR